MMLLDLRFDEDAPSEAWCLQFKEQMNPSNDDNGLALSGRETSVANKDETTIQVSDGPVSECSSSSELSSELDQEAISPKPTVCTLLPDQYLPCGIGPRNWVAPLHLTSTDIRRWELCASVIIELAKTDSREYEYGLAKIEIDNLERFLQRLGFTTPFVINIRNFEIDGIMDSWPNCIENTSVLLEIGHVLLFLLRFFVPLTAAYGGIHLSAWNFEFPSRVESIIWRTACFIIIGSSFALLALPSWEALDDYSDQFHDGPRPKDWEKRRALNLMGFKFIKALNKTASYGFGGLLPLCYAASRIYLVVESFISLRHVPIGVYAAVPWVENIPHV